MIRKDFLSQFHHLRQVSAEADFPLRQSGKPAAVLIPVVDYGDHLALMFTQRAAHLKHHAGQVSFPGGKREASDLSLVDTALRETREEIGLVERHIEVLGNLPDFRTVSGFVVRPFIGMVSPPFELALDENEVDTVFEVPLDFALDQRNHYVHWVERKQYRHPIYFIPWEDKHIWGATAAFVRTLSNHIQLEAAAI